jgi:putative Mn2+ efflux pump MntP
MLDDLIIFSLAVLALDTNIGQRYTKYCKIIGGLVLLILGGIMVFQPGMLH